MQRRRAILVVALWLFAPAVHAAGEDSEAAQCDGNTFEIVECLKAKTARWDRRLNTAYQQALNDAAPQQRTQLQAAQRLWIQYRDANCLYYGLGEGTISRIDAGECMRSMTESRARELESIGRP
jgi:uncharacterized protein YecT (DUF1311 family)